jgi:ABC-2 type transport system permease protein
MISDAPIPATARSLSPVNRDSHPTLPRVIVSEWTKLRSLRSTRWSLLIAVVLTVGLPILFATVVESRWGTMNPAERARRNPLDIALVGTNIAQLAIGVLGVLVITGEYATGMIRASLTAVPRRLPVLWAKLTVFAVVSFTLTLPSVLIAFYASQAVLNQKGILQISFSSPGVARSVIGGAVFLTLSGMFAMAIGAMMRNTAGGISVFAAVFFVIPPLLNLLPSSWQNAVAPYLPDAAARAIFSLTHDSGSLAPGPGLLLFCGYVVVAVAGAAVLLNRRDA